LDCANPSCDPSNAVNAAEENAYDLHFRFFAPFAVELKPEDPTINDHLGHAYWRVGRVLEARFQWSHARDLKPEPDDLVKIEAKLKSGLPDDTAPEAEHKKPGGG
jgi:hypothetical protein